MLRLIAVLIAVVAALLVVSVTQAQETTRLTGLPPGKVTYRSLAEMGNIPDAHLMAQDHQQRRTGVTSSGVRFVIHDDVPPQVTKFVDDEQGRMSRSNSDKLPKVKGHLASTKVAGYRIDGEHLYRVFEDGNTKVLLHIWDYPREGASVLVVTDFRNTEVNGTPAKFTALRHADDPVMWRLDWTTDTHQYDLTTVGGSADWAFDYLTKIAKGL